jgi:ubiquinone/menaquinone biosynthesis C-methylase UbiE
MRTFERADGTLLPVVPGFRDSVLRARPSGTPKPHWSDADYEAGARKRVAQAKRRSEQIAAALGGSAGQRGLEIGCGAGLDCVLAALGGMTAVTGIDRASPLLAGGEQRDRALRLVGAAATLAGAHEEPEVLLARLPVDIRSMDATALELDDSSMDVVWSRTALEHLQPLDRALRETARVLRPGGVAHHVIDPFYWLKGCHARGLTEMPWAHARLEPADYERFVAAAESRGRAAKRTAYLGTLNPLTLDGWREAIESTEAFDLVEWHEHHSPVALDALARHPEVLEGTLPGVTARDLTCSSITAVLRR